MKLTLFMIVLTIPLIYLLFLVYMSGRSNKVDGKESNVEKPSFEKWRSVIIGRLNHVRNYCKEETYKRKLVQKQKIFWFASHGIGYCPNAKAGTTTWLTLLTNVKKNVHEYALKNNRERPKNSISYIFLTCVRHPFLRLVSAYLDKIQENFHGISDTIFSTLKRVPERSSKWEDQLLVPGIDLAHSPTFIEFVKYVLEELSHCPDDKTNCPYYINVHWRPQVVRCNPCRLPFNFIAKIETIYEDLEYLQQLMWRTNKVVLKVDRSSNINHKNMSGDRETEMKLISTLSQELKLQIYEAYKADFLAFDYSPDIY